MAPKGPFFTSGFVKGHLRGVFLKGDPFRNGSFFSIAACKSSKMWPLRGN